MLYAYKAEIQFWLVESLLNANAVDGCMLQSTALAFSGKDMSEKVIGNSVIIQLLHYRLLLQTSVGLS